MTAYEMRIPQSQFDAWDEIDKAYAIEVRREKMKMEAWENEVAAREMKAHQGKT